MNWRWLNRNSSTTGSTAIIEPAMSSWKFVLTSLRKIVSPTWIGRRSGESVTMSGHWKSFQARIAVSRAMIASAGRESGIANRQRNRRWPQPSSTAAS